MPGKRAFYGFGPKTAEALYKSVAPVDDYKENIPSKLISRGGGSLLFTYTLREPFSSTNRASADVQRPLGGGLSENITVHDPLELMTDQNAGDQGFALKVGGDFIAIQAPCTSVEEGGGDGSLEPPIDEDPITPSLITG